MLYSLFLSLGGHTKICSYDIFPSDSLCSSFTNLSTSSIISSGVADTYICSLLSNTFLRTEYDNSVFVLKFESA